MNTNLSDCYQLLLGGLENSSADAAWFRRTVMITRPMWSVTVGTLFVVSALVAKRGIVMFVFPFSALDAPCRSCALSWVAKALASCYGSVVALHLSVCTSPHMT